MPTVAAGGGHILNIDFCCCKFVKEATGQRAARGKTNPLLTMKNKKKKKNKEKKLGKASSVAEDLADTQAELEAQSAIPSAGKESGKESEDSAKTQSDSALKAVMIRRSEEAQSAFSSFN